MKRFFLTLTAAVAVATIQPATIVSKSEASNKKLTTKEKAIDLTGKVAIAAGFVALSGLLTYQIYNEELALQAYSDAYEIAYATAVKLIAEGKLIVPANSMYQDFITEVIRVGIHEKNILTEHLSTSTFEILKKGWYCSYTPVAAFFSYVFTGASLFDLALDIKNTTTNYFYRKKQEKRA